MKSSSTHNSPVYSLLALYMPLTVIAAFVFLVEKWLPLPSIFLLIIACVSALAAFIYCDVTKAGKSGKAASPVPGGMAAMAVSYIFSSLFFQGLNREKWFLWKELFMPAIPTILASLETLYVWISIVLLRRLFYARKRFETHITKHRGEQLQKVLERDPELLSYNGVEITKARRRYLFQLIIIGAVAFAVVFSGITLPLQLSLLLLVMVISGICICGLFGILRREHHHAGEGIVLSVLDRIKHILAMGVFSALAIAGSLVLSLNKNLLPFSAISGFFSRVFGQISNSPLAENAETAAPASPEQLFSFLSGMENTAVWQVWKGLPYIFLALIIVGFVLFLSFSMRTRIKVSRKEQPVNQSVGRTIIEWFKRLLFALGSLFGKDKTQPESNKPSAGQIRRTSEAIRSAYSQAKKQDMQQSVTLFARLIIWGSEIRHVLWKPAHGPGEYCGLLAASTPSQTAAQQTAASQTAPQATSQIAQSGEIIRCGTLFEQALYSTEVLSAVERDEFRELVEAITGGA